MIVMLLGWVFLGGGGNMKNWFSRWTSKRHSFHGNKIEAIKYQLLARLSIVGKCCLWCCDMDGIDMSSNELR